jgi:hypothetical protein
MCERAVYGDGAALYEGRRFLYYRYIAGQESCADSGRIREADESDPPDSHATNFFYKKKKGFRRRTHINANVRSGLQRR